MAPLSTPTRLCHTLMQQQPVVHAGPNLSAFTVCEFSCSCCRSTTASAADALSTFLLADATALEEFCRQVDGLGALKVGVGCLLWWRIIPYHP